MAWLAKIDARVARASAPARWSYQVCKWSLVALGAFIAIVSAWREFHEGRLGIGLGIVVSTVLAAISGIMDTVYPPPAA
jgi:hypothetical protein